MRECALVTMGLIKFNYKFKLDDFQAHKKDKKNETQQP